MLYSNGDVIAQINSEVDKFAHMLCLRKNKSAVM